MLVVHKIIISVSSRHSCYFRLTQELDCLLVVRAINRVLPKINLVSTQVLRTTFVKTISHNQYLLTNLYKQNEITFANSGLPSERINLSPFTKDFRGGGHILSMK